MRFMHSRSELIEYIRRLRKEVRDLVNMLEEGFDDFDWLEATNDLLAETEFAKKGEES